LIHDGETLLINGGSTTSIFSGNLERLKLTIVTNNLGVPAALPADGAAEVYILGGRYRRNARVTTGPMLVSGTRVTVDTAVIGVSGIAADEGLTAANLEESLVAGEMIAAAEE